jgi:hypothetical protein
MKYFFTILLTTSLISIKVLSQTGLEGIVVEKYYISDSADSLNASDQGATSPLFIGSTTYRVYANLLPGYRINMMWGSSTHTLNFSTTTSFYNDPNYGGSIYSGTSVNNTKKHTTLIDSYITIGAVAAGKIGVLKTEDTDGTIGNIQGILANNNLEMGLPIMGTSGMDGLMPGTPQIPNVLGLTTELDIFDQTPGNDFTCNDCAIAALAGVSGVTPSNHVLLGQFTTDGIFSFKLNLQVLDTIPGNATIYVSDSVIAGEFDDLTIFEPTLIYSSEQSVGISESKEFQVTIAPNPNDGLFVLNNPASFPLPFSIFDITGKLIYTSKIESSEMSIDIQNLDSGLYTILVAFEDRFQALRFIKN